MYHKILILTYNIMKVVFSPSVISILISVIPKLDQNVHSQPFECLFSITSITGIVLQDFGPVSLLYTSVCWYVTVFKMFKALDNSWREKYCIFL